MIAQTHCLFCSLACPLSLVSERGEHFGIDCETGEPRSSHGLCGRGISLVDLVQHPRRFANALQRQEGRRVPLSLAEAGEAFARLLDEALAEGRVALIADGNLPCEDLVAMACWCASRQGQVEMAVYLPPMDLEALDGLSAVRAPLLRPVDLAACDGVVVVGDVLATHPVLGRPLLDWKYAHRRNLFAVVDTHLSVTSRFGNLPLIVPPGEHQEVLCQLLERLAIQPSVEFQRVLRRAADGGSLYGSLEALAKQVQKVQKLAVVMVPELTKNADWLSAAALAGELAKEKGGLLPLYTYGNAVGAYRVLRHLGLKRLPELLGGTLPWAAVVEVGCDLQQTYPPAILRSLYGSQTRKVVLVSLYTEQVEKANLAIALRLPAEWEGTAIDGSGEEKELKPAAPPAAGTLGAGDFFRRLLKERPFEKREPWKEIPEPAPRPKIKPAAIEALEDGAVRLLATVSPAHFDDGGLTRQAGWTAYWQAEPMVAMAPETALRLGVRSGDEVVLQQDGQTLRLACRIEPSLTSSLALVSVHFPEVRQFLPWRLEGDRLCCPAPVVQVKAADL